MTTPRLAYARQLYCSFCGKTSDQVDKLIAGPTVFICNECVTLCQEIVTEKRDVAPPFTPAQEERLRTIIREEGAA